MTLLGHGKTYLWFSSTRAPIFGGAPTIFLISMYAYARMKTVNAEVYYQEYITGYVLLIMYQIATTRRL